MLGGNEFGTPLPIVTDDGGTPFAVVVIPVDDKLAVKTYMKEGVTRGSSAVRKRLKEWLTSFKDRIGHQIDLKIGVAGMWLFRMTLGWNHSRMGRIMKEVPNAEEESSNVKHLGDVVLRRQMEPSSGSRFLGTLGAFGSWLGEETYGN